MSELSTPVRGSDEQKKLHDELFKKHHVLAPRDPNVSLSSTKSDTNDSANSTFDSDANFSIITHHQVANDPQTPRYREEFKRRPNTDLDLSPAEPSPRKKILNGSPRSLGVKNVSNSLHKLALSNSNTGSSAPSTAVLESQSQPPSSIMKKSNFNYDRETSKRMVAKIPELSSAIDSNGELNPLKASKAVTFSPRKQFMNFPKPGRYSSPLSDAINGKPRSVRSPYLRSPRKVKSTGTSSSDWVDDDLQQEEDEAGREQQSKKNQSRKKKSSSSTRNGKGIMSAIFNPHTPYIISLYLQLLFNVAIVSILLYFVYTFISTVRADVENKVDSYATDIIQEIAICAREYSRNNCQPGHRVVALEAACSEWEKCMNRDPTTVGRARIGAETFAEIINGFIKPISWKSMFFIVFITVGSLVLTNAAFGTYRNYSGEDLRPPPQQSYSDVPMTPHILQTPHQTPYKSLQVNPAYTRYYTPKASSPNSGALVRQRNRSAKKAKK